MNESDQYQPYGPQPMPSTEPNAPGADPEDEEWAEARAGVAPGQEVLEANILEVLHTCFDPEIPVDIYELGLIYKIGVDRDSKVWIDMTLTSPACPVAGILPGQVEGKIQAMPGVTDAKVNITWDPPWTPEMMSEAAKLELGLM